MQKNVAALAGIFPNTVPLKPRLPPNTLSPVGSSCLHNYTPNAPDSLTVLAPSVNFEPWLSVAAGGAASRLERLRGTSVLQAL